LIPTKGRIRFVRIPSFPLPKTAGIADAGPDPFEMFDRRGTIEMLV